MSALPIFQECYELSKYFANFETEFGLLPTSPGMVSLCAKVVFSKCKITLCHWLQPCKGFALPNLGNILMLYPLHVLTLAHYASWFFSVVLSHFPLLGFVLTVPVTETFFFSSLLLAWLA